MHIKSSVLLNTSFVIPQYHKDVLLLEAGHEEGVLIHMLCEFQ